MNKTKIAVVGVGAVAVAIGLWLALRNKSSDKPVGDTGDGDIGDVPDVDSPIPILPNIDHPGNWLSLMPDTPSSDWITAFQSDNIHRDLGSGLYINYDTMDTNFYDSEGNPIGNVSGEPFTYSDGYWSYLYMWHLYLSVEDMTLKNSTIIPSVYESNTPYNNIDQFSGYSYPSHLHYNGWIPKWASPEGSDDDNVWVPAVIPVENKQLIYQRPFILKRYPYWMPEGKVWTSGRVRDNNMTYISGKQWFTE